MSKDKKQIFIIEFPLKTQKYQENILDTRFEIGRKIYNALVKITQKRYHEMTKTKKWRNGDFILRKEMLKEYHLSEYSFHADVKNMQHHFKTHIDSSTAQKIGTRLWKAYEKVIFGNGKKVHFQRYGEFNSLEGKSNKTGIRLLDNNIVWNGLKITVNIDYSNPYEATAMENEILYCRILRKFIRNKYRYYVQIILKGVPPIKIKKSTGEFKHTIGSGDVGLDIGTQTIAISSQANVKLFELADKVQNIENKKRLIQRKMDKSRRKTNPDNFNTDGTIKKQGRKKVKWLMSKHYEKLRNELKEAYRKQADIRKYQHECMANYIISLGDKIYVEKMNFKGLQKRAKKTEKNKDGKIKKKKRFGKSLANKAPAMLLTIIERKLKTHEKELIKINTTKARASQFNHFDRTYVKKKLSQRFNNYNGMKIQRDLYSAFLIMNINEDLETFDIDKCTTRYDKFYELHNKEVNRLKGQKNLSSIAI